MIRGDTRHYEHVADRCAEGLMRVQLDFGVPVLNGVLAVERVEDAEAPQAAATVTRARSRTRRIGNGQSSGAAAMNKNTQGKPR